MNLTLGDVQKTTLIPLAIVQIKSGENIQEFMAKKQLKLLMYSELI